MSPREQFLVYVGADFCPDHSSLPPAITGKPGEWELRIGGPECTYFGATGTPGTLSLRSGIGPTPGFSNNRLMLSHRRPNNI